METKKKNIKGSKGFEHVCCECGETMFLEKHRTCSPLCKSCHGYKWLLVDSKCHCCNRIIKAEDYQKDEYLKRRKL